MKPAYVFVGAVMLAACARSATLPLSADIVQITTSAAPACGQSGAQSVALRRAAIETINRGYDKFLIVGDQYANNVRIIGRTPVQAYTYGTATAVGYGNMATAHGSSQTYYTGGFPIIGGTHNQGIVVRMFRADDAAGARAISARDQLGPEWKKIIRESPATTC